MDAGKVLYDNWNRIGTLNNERTMRIKFQNCFSCSTSKEKHKLINIILKTLPEKIRKVDKFAKKKQYLIG